MKAYTKEQLEIIEKVFIKRLPESALIKNNIKLLDYKELQEILDWYIAKNDYISFETIFWFFSLKLDIKEREKLYQKYILEQSHYVHEEMASAFQTIFNNNTENIPILLKAIDNIPEYLEDDDFKYPYIRKIIYAIGAQPQPESLLALEKLASETNDTEIKKLALHQLEKRKELGRWEYEKNVIS